jgi:hypothetical protein
MSRLIKFRTKNAEVTWRRRAADRLWTLAGGPNGVRFDKASAKAHKKARELIERLCDFAANDLSGMVGNYWKSVIERRPLGCDEAQRLAVQVACLCRLSTRERSDRGGRRNLFALNESDAPVQGELSLEEAAEVMRALPPEQRELPEVKAFLQRKK